MQPERDEGAAQHQAEPLAHVALSHERRAGVVAEIGAAEVAVKDLAHVDHARDRAVLEAADEERALARPSTPPQIRGVGRAARRRGDPRPEHAPARLDERQELVAVTRGRRTQEDAPTDLERARGSRARCSPRACPAPRARAPTGTCCHGARYFLRRTTTMLIGCRDRSSTWCGLKPKNHRTHSKPPASSTTVFNSCGKTMRERWV